MPKFVIQFKNCHYNRDLGFEDSLRDATRYPTREAAEVAAHDIPGVEKILEVPDTVTVEVTFYKPEEKLPERGKVVISDSGDLVMLPTYKLIRKFDLEDWVFAISGYSGPVLYDRKVRAWAYIPRIDYTPVEEK